MWALTASVAPVKAGIAHCNTVSWRCALAAWTGVPLVGVVPSSTGAPSACSSLALSIRDQAVVARASPVSAVLVMVAVATPRWLATRPLLAASRIVPPARWAAIPAKFTGVHRAQPALATRRRCWGWSTAAAAPLSPTAPISDPPNQAARPTSCRLRARVLSFAMPCISSGTDNGMGAPPKEASGSLPRCIRSAAVVAEPVLVALDLDLLLADLLGHLTLVGHGLGVKADPLLGNGPLADHDLLLAQGDLVLLLGDVGAAGGRVQVGVGDRLALDPDLLAGHRHRHLLGLGGDVLAEPGPAALAGLGSDLELLLGAGHGVVAGAGGQAAVGAVLAVVEAVVAVQLGLVVLGQLAVGLHGGRVLDLLLVVGHLHAVTDVLGLGERHEGGLGGEQAAGDRGPLWLAGLVVEVDGVDRAELVAGRVDHGAALPGLGGLDAWCWHGSSFPLLRWMVGWRAG